MSQSRTKNKKKKAASLIVSIIVPTLNEEKNIKSVKGVGCTGPLSNIEKDSLFINVFFIFWDAQAKLTTLFRAPIISGFNFGIRADQFKTLGGFDESNRLYEDIELSFKLAKSGKIIFSNKMRVLTSARRQKQIPLMKCITMGLKYMFTKKSITWNEYRNDF